MGGLQGRRPSKSGFAAPEPSPHMSCYLEDVRGARMWSFTAVLYLLLVVRFFALRAKKRTTAEMGGTMLPSILSLTKGRQSAFESATA